MPLPKMPTRPATILPAPKKAPTLRSSQGRQQGDDDPDASSSSAAAKAAAVTPVVKTPAATKQASAPAAAGKQAASKKAATKQSARQDAEQTAAKQPAAEPVAAKKAASKKAATKKAASKQATSAPAPAKKAATKQPVEAPLPPPEARESAASSPRAAKGTEHAPRAELSADPRPGRRLFVLDTNVLLHDPSSLFRFQEHDVFVPMTTLEELDHNKKGMSEVARNARQVSRTLDQLIADEVHIREGVALSALGNREARGRLWLQTDTKIGELPAELPGSKGDNQILGVVRGLQARHTDQRVVLVSKDINMRLKARALGLAAEDYFNDKVLEDADLLYTGMMELPSDFWQQIGENVESWQNGGSTYYRLSGDICRQFTINQFVFLEGELPLYAQVLELDDDTAVLQTLRDYSHRKNNVWGVTARNREQNFALNLLMNPECDFVSLLGQAGTGKTLLALAAGLTQVLETRRFSEIIVTRATVPVGDDIGFLPGTEEEKMQPWMGALDDNLEVLNAGDSSAGGEWGRSATLDLIRSKIRVKSLNFMRGRTFLNKFLILDEAQNLTPKQMKTLITRAGPGTKVVCLGNIAQIDTPYLTEGSSGLTYVVDRFRGWPHAGHITLQRGERSRLADFAAEIL